MVCLLGDSGGPLFLVSPDTMSAVCLYGVVSYGVAGEGCGHPEFPTVAARVSSYIDMFNLKEDQNSYFTRRVDRTEVLPDNKDIDGDGHGKDSDKKNDENEEKEVSVASKISRMFYTYLIGFLLNLIIFY